MRFLPLSRLLLALLLGSLLPSLLLAAGPRVLPADKLPNDARLGPLKDLNGYFPFTPAEDKQQWERRAERVRRQILVSNGLWPLPERTPLNAVVHGKVDRDEYTVERVYFESVPGFFVTGSLYRPKNAKGKLPCVISPHGHFPGGRFGDTGGDNGARGIKQQIEQGAEKYEEGGRSPLQARCVQLARMGCVVFHYDMIGYADSQQISYELAHRFAKQRPEMNTTENWGLFSPQATARLQSILGMQTWNSVRALDFVTSLPDVDPARIGVTGASGGGTQTFLISAIDPRVAVSAPAVMVSTSMQGGCTCENCSALRVDTGNVEFAALFAPKPLLMTAANDWTKEMATKGFPELQQHYQLLGQPENVALAAYLQFGHNYNYVSRAAMYDWMNKHLKLNQQDTTETDYRRLSTEEMTVWDDKHPAPPSGPDFERALLKKIATASDVQIAKLQPTDAASLEKYRNVVGGAIDVLVGRNLPAAADITYDRISKSDKGNYLEVLALLRNKLPAGEQEELPVVFLHPKQWDGQVVIWIDEAGKGGLYGDDGTPLPAVKKLLDAGVTVLGADLLYQGEFLADGQPLKATRRVGNPREFAGYTFGYNRPLVSQRAGDVLTLISYVRNHEMNPKQVSLVATTGAAPIVAAALAQSRYAVDAAAIQTGGFRFGKLLDLQDVNFLAGGAKYGDLPGILALAAPASLWLDGESPADVAVVKGAYAAADKLDRLTLYQGKPAESLDAAVTWLLSRGK